MTKYFQKGLFYKSLYANKLEHLSQSKFTTFGQGKEPTIRVRSNTRLLSFAPALRSIDKGVSDISDKHSSLLRYGVK